MPFQIVYDDITGIHTEAVCLERSKASGGRTSLAYGSDRNAAGPVIENLPGVKARYVILYTADPGELIKNIGEEVQAAECRTYAAAIYREVFMLAKARQISSLGLPVIDTGEPEPLHTALEAVRDFLMENEMDIYLNADRDMFSADEKRAAIRSYIERHYEPEKGAQEQLSMCEAVKPYGVQPLEGLLEHMGETFTEMLMRLIDEKGRTDADVYRKANLDRRLFSKIRSNREYQPKKSTVLALAISLELSLDETKELLERAGYAFSASRKSDIIIRYFIEHREYDLFSINEILFFFHQPLLGSLK